MVYDECCRNNATFASVTESVKWQLVAIKLKDLFWSAPHFPDSGLKFNCVACLSFWGALVILFYTLLTFLVQGISLAISRFFLVAHGYLKKG